MYDSAVLSILVAQLLPLLLALLGAIVGVALGLLMGSQVTTRTWCVVIGLVSGLAIAGAAYLICDGYRIEARVRVLGETIRVEIDGATTIEYGMRRAAEQGTFVLSDWVDQIEAWRTRNNGFLERELPNSGADVRFRTGSGAVGQRGDVFEYTRLGVLRGNLMAVLDNLPSYVQRSK